MGKVLSVFSTSPGKLASPTIIKEVREYKDMKPLQRAAQVVDGEKGGNLQLGYIHCGILEMLLKSAIRNDEKKVMKNQYSEKALAEIKDFQVKETEVKDLIWNMIKQKYTCEGQPCTKAQFADLKRKLDSEVRQGWAGKQLANPLLFGVRDKTASAQSVYLPYIPQTQLEYHYGPQLPYSGVSATSVMAENALVMPLFLFICFLCVTIACLATICSSVAGFVFARRTAPRDHQKEHAYQV